MITEFKKHNVNAEMIDEVMEKVDNKYLQLKLADARNILKKYQDRIQGNYIDEADSLDLLAQNIELVDFLMMQLFILMNLQGSRQMSIRLLRSCALWQKRLMLRFAQIL